MSGWTRRDTCKIGSPQRSVTAILVVNQPPSYEIGGRDLAAPLVDIVVLRAEVAGLRQVTSAGRDSDGSSYLPTSLYERFHIDAPAT